MTKLNQAIKESFKNSWRLGILVALTTFLSAYIIVKGKIGTLTITASIIDVRAQILSKGIAPALGEKVLGLFQGFISIDMPSFIGLLIGSILLVFLGRTFVNWTGWKFTFLGKGKIGDMFTILFFGTVLTALLLGMVTGIGFVTTLLALGIYYILISIIIGVLMQVKEIARFVK